MNELSTMRHENALSITEQYPETKYNLLVPIKTVAEIAEIHKPVMNVVYISTNEADKEIYLQTKPDGWALTKKALTKLMKAAGIKIKASEPVLPTQCEKCAAVNRGIGRAVNCGSCKNKDVKHRVVITMPQLTGENVEVVATKEILFDEVTATMTPKQAAEFAKFRSEMCESKALNRALRIAMQIKATYTKAELAKPFVVAYLVPNLDNEAVKAEAVKNFFGATKELYGATAEAAEAQHTIYAANKADEDDSGYEPPSERIVIPDEEELGEFMEIPQEAYREQPQQAVHSQPQRRAYRREEPPMAYAPTRAGDAEDADETICQMCGKKLSSGVINYSVKNFGKPYCMDCQKKLA